MKYFFKHNQMVILKKNGDIERTKLIMNIRPRPMLIKGDVLETYVLNNIAAQQRWFYVLNTGKVNTFQYSQNGTDLITHSFDKGSTTNFIDWSYIPFEFSDIRYDGITFKLATDDNGILQLVVDTVILEQYKNNCWDYICSLYQIMCICRR